MAVIESATAIHIGIPLVGGGLIGFATGYIPRKLIKIAIVGLGLIFALIAYLEYKRQITVDWATVQNQTGAFIQRSTQQMLDTVNRTAQELNHNHDLNYIVISMLPSLYLRLVVSFLGYFQDYQEVERFYLSKLGFLHLHLRSSRASDANASHES